MRALVFHPAAGRWELSELPDPSPGPDDLLVRVEAAGLNRADLLMREGTYVPSDAGWTVAPNRVGFEFAGRVEAVGVGVRGFTPGQLVMAQAGGACAELVTLDHRLALPVPPGFSMIEAAAAPSALLTEFDALVGLAALRPGERVLVTGAASGVGLVGVRLAKAWGASVVFATTRSPGKAALLRSQGADQVIITGEESIVAGVLGQAPSGFDVALDHVGGTAFTDLLGAAAVGARVVQIGRLAGRESVIDLETLAARRLHLIGTTFRGRTADELRTLTARLADALETSLGGTVRPVIDAVFPLADAESAASRLAAGPSGKIVLSLTKEVSP